jgi:hypothetical protein
VHIIDIAAVCVAVVVLLACAVVLARQRFMLRAEGTIPVALRLSATSRWQYGVARYAGSQLRWYRSLGVGTRPNRVLERRRVSVVGRVVPGKADLQALPPTAVIVECRDGEVDVYLALGESAYTGFVSWLESSAPLA